MPTSAIAGYKAALFVSTSTGGAVARLAELKDYTLTVNHTEIDATSHDSSGVREVIAGITDWSGSANLLHIMADAKHKGIFDLMFTRVKAKFEFYPTGSSSDGNYTGEGFFTGFELGAPGEDALGNSVSFVGTGALTRSSSST